MATEIIIPTICNYDQFQAICNDLGQYGTQGHEQIDLRFNPKDGSYVPYTKEADHWLVAFFKSLFYREAVDEENKGLAVCRFFQDHENRFPIPVKTLETLSPLSQEYRTVRVAYAQLLKSAQELDLRQNAPEEFVLKRDDETARAFQQYQQDIEALRQTHTREAQEFPGLRSLLVETQRDSLSTLANKRREDLDTIQRAGVQQIAVLQKEVEELSKVNERLYNTVVIGPDGQQYFMHLSSIKSVLEDGWSHATALSELALSSKEKEQFPELLYAFKLSAYQLQTLLNRYAKADPPVFIQRTKI